jgi:DNA-directed RNA polymerase specialized sigma24 family protein
MANRLLAQILIKDSNSQKERIILLYNCGFSQSQIADLLRIKDNIVTSTISKSKAKISKAKK